MRHEEVLQLMHDYLPYYRKLGDYGRMYEIHKESPQAVPDPEQYIQENMARYAYSFQWIEPHLDIEIRALELGQYHSFFSRFLTYMRPSVVVELANSDFRHVLPNPNVWFSIVLCMDVLQYIKDQEGSTPKHWVNFSGVEKFLWECHRITRQRGYLFISTPNVNSFRNLERLLKMQTPLRSPTHFREYSPEQLRTLVEKRGFQVERLETLDIYSQNGLEGIKSMVAGNGFDSKNRGDEIFLLAKRPI